MLDVILRDSKWKIRSYRGSLGHGHTGFVHVPNEVKCDSSKYMFIKDRVANTTIRTRTPERRPGICPSTNAEVDARWQQQLDNVELQDTNWLGERDEDIVFVCCGRNLSVGRVLRCLESLARQTRGKVSCTTREANGAPSAGSSTSIDDSIGSLPEERDITCGIVVLDDATDNYEDIRDYIFDKARAMFGPEHVTCVNSGIRNGFMRNTDHMIRHVCTNPKSVVVTLDLDDMLLGTRVVSLLTSLFFPADEVECAIGGMIRNDKCKHYPLDAKSPRQARGGGNTWQHLRAFRKELFDNIPVEHLKDVEGKWLQIACDWALMIPIVEQAKATRFIDSADEGPLYLYEPCLPYGSSKGVVQAAAIEGKISSVASLLQQAATFQSRRARRYHETALPSKFLSEKARCRVFPKNEHGDEIVLYYKGNVTQDAHVPVRINSECLSGDILGSYKCDCGPQLQSFLKHIEKEGCGVLVYIKGHEGRGAGLFNKIGAYQMMDEQPSLHHIRALKLFNCESDTRNYADAVYALEQLGVHRIRLHTNNPLKLEAVKRVFVGQDCVLQQEVPSVSTSFNKKYLMEKVQDCQHRGLLLWLDTMPSTDGSDDSVDTANVGTQGSSLTESYSPHLSASPQEDSSCQEDLRPPSQPLWKRERKR